MNHRDLLLKYMKHVLLEEGSTFTYWLPMRGKASEPWEALGDPYFSKEEADELRDIDGEIKAEGSGAL